MDDIGKVKRNIAKMLDGGASEGEIDAYIGAEGVSLDQLNQPQAMTVSAASPPKYQITDTRGLVSPEVLNQRKSENVDVMSRIQRGFMDGVNGLAQLTQNMLPQSVQNLTPDINQYLTLQEQQYQAQRAATGQTGVDWARLGGNLIPAIAATAAMPGAAPATLPGLMAESGAIGAAFGAAQPVYGAGDFWNEKAKQAGTGAAFGAAAAPVAGAVSRVISPKANPAARKLMDEGVTPTPGQVMGGAWKTTEEKMTSLPIMGDLIRWGQKRGVDEFNRAAYNRALEPIGQNASKLPVGRAGVKAVKTALSKAYDDILPKISFQADDVFAQEFAAVNQMTASLPDDVVRQYQKVIQNKFLDNMTLSGRMSGESLKKVESELGRIGVGYRKSPDFDQRQLGDAIHEVQAAIRRTLERSNPDYAEKLRAINKGYANYAIIRNAASRAGTEGGFTPVQLDAAVRAMDKSVGKGATATGTANMQDLTDAGRQVLANKYPDSGTIGRGLLDGGVLGAGLYNPAIPASLAAGGIPYTPVTQRIMASLLEIRPQGTESVGRAVRSSSPALGVGASSAFMQE